MGIGRCCAYTRAGAPAAAPPSKPIKSRRRIVTPISLGPCSPHARSCPHSWRSEQAARQIALSARQRVDVLDVLRQRRFAPSRAAVLGAEHLAVARRDVDLLVVGGMQADRQQRAMRLDLVEALP